MIDEESEDHWLSVNDWHRYGQALFLNGEKKRGLEYLQKQIQINERKVRLKRTHFSGLAAYYDLAGIYAVMGEKEKAYEWLQKFTEQDGWIKLGLIRYVQYDIQFDNLREDKRFQALIQQIEETTRKVHENVFNSILRDEI